MKKKRKKAETTNNELSLKNEIIGLFLLLVSVFLIFSVISYNPNDPSFFTDREAKSVSNFGGRIGAQLAALLFNLVGYSSYIVVFYLLFITVFFFFNKKIPNIVTKNSGYLLLVISFAAFLATVKTKVMIDGQAVHTGGIIGFFINDFFEGQIKGFFTFILFFALITVALVLIAKFSLRKIFKFFINLGRKGLAKLSEFSKKQLEKYKKYKRIKRIEEKYNTKAKEVEEARMEESPRHPEPEKEEEPSSPPRPKRQLVKQPSKLPEESSLFGDWEEETTADGSGYRTPPLTYLDAPTERSKIDYKELEDKKDELARRLAEFRIRGNIVEYTPGPVITTYEFVPDTGVKVRDVTNLSEDLALVARAQYVRIERILGKKAIGIEVPNKKREIIHLREILESKDYQQSKSPLTIALGKSKSGEIFCSDLREMPHVIIAGATGSGKSVAIHTLLLSFLFKSSPDEVKLVLIDPKRVELALYNRLPHLLTPVVVNTKLAKNALDWAVFEMEERYKKLALIQVRNLEQYNKKIELLTQTEDEEALENIDNPEKIPYIVIVIDEFADLMMESSKEIEHNVARIAQKARAVGIHLVLATQRPSTDVITGTIKNNFPSRIALAVPSKHDSRTIIDGMGAEKLLGNGDMLFLPPKTATLVRLHCAYVSEEETLRVVNFLSKMGRPKFNTQVVKPQKAEEEGGEDGGDLDAMFYEAADVVVSSGQASASFLQRRMSIGYARAGRLIDQLQSHGVVSAPDSKNKREILMNQSELYEMQKQQFSNE